MTKRRPRRTVAAKVDAGLAAEYQAVYARAFGGRRPRKESLARFLAGFVEDRLAEEIAFARSEAPRGDE